MAIAFTSGHYTDGSFDSSAHPTFAHNTTSDSIFWAWYTNFNSTANSITGVNCGASAMTKLCDVSSAHVTLDMSVWYVFSPPSGGSTSIVATQSGTGNWLMQGVSYAGTDTSALGTTVTTGPEAAASGNHGQFSITTANANSWVVMFLEEQAQSGTLSSGTNTTNRGHMGSFPGCGTNDSGILSAGSISLDFGVVSSGYVLGVLAEMKVLGGGGGGRAVFRVPSMTGLGAGGPFFSDPLSDREQMVKRDHIYVPERYAA